MLKPVPLSIYSTDKPAALIRDFLWFVTALLSVLLFVEFMDLLYNYYIDLLLCLKCLVCAFTLMFSE